MAGPATALMHALSVHRITVYLWLCAITCVSNGQCGGALLLRLVNGLPPHAGEALSGPATTQSPALVIHQVIMCISSRAGAAAGAPGEGRRAAGEGRHHVSVIICCADASHHHVHTIMCAGALLVRLVKADELPAKGGTTSY